MMSDDNTSDFEIDEDFLRDAFGERGEQDMGFLKPTTTEKNLGLRTSAHCVNIQPPANPKYENISKPRDALYSYNTKGKDRVPILSTTAYRGGSSNNLDSIAEHQGAFSSTLLGPRNICDTGLVTTTPRAIAKKTSVRRRKFPGPAGLLPDKISDRSFDSSFLNDSKLDACPTEEDAICSQSSTDEIDGSPWLQLLKDFDLSESSRLSCYNITWIKRRASARLLAGRKVPFLAIVIKSIDFYSTDPSVVLQDKTGEISGTLHRDFLEKYPSQLKPGTVLVLHRLGVVSTGFPVKRHYLNITLNNLISIYDMDDTTESSDVRLTSVKNISMSEIIEEIDKSEAQKMNISTLKDKTNVQQNMSSNSLFSGPGTSTNFSFKASSIPNISHSNNYSDTRRPFNKFVGLGNLDRSPFPKCSSATDANLALPISPTKKKACQSTYPNGNQCEVRPKVARVSEDAMTVEPSDVSSCTTPARPSEDAAVVDSIFEGFDCSSLFEDF